MQLLQVVFEGFKTSNTWSCMVIHPGMTTRFVFVELNTVFISGVKMPFNYFQHQHPLFFLDYPWPTVAPHWFSNIEVGMLQCLLWAPARWVLYCDLKLRMVLT